MNAPDKPSIIKDLAEQARVTPPKVTALPPLHTWGLRTLADAYKPRPPAQFAIHGLFKQPSLNIAYGGPGSLKSIVLADAAVCVAAGVPWLPAMPGEAPTTPFPVKQSPVLWIDVDNGELESDERFEALGKARGLPENLPLYYTSMPSPWPDLSSEEFAAQLADLIKSLGAGFVVIDNLGLITGDVEENTSKMAHVMGNLRRIAEQTGAALVVIHHQRKSGSPAGRKGETIRGSSTIEASLNIGLLIDRIEGTDEITAIATKVRGAPVAEFGALFTYEHKPGSQELKEARCFGRKVESATSQLIERIRAAIQGELRKLGEASQQNLVREVQGNLTLLGINAGDKKIRAHLKQMAEEGTIQQSKGEKNAIVYRLAVSTAGREEEVVF